MSFATSNRAADVKWTPMWGRVLLRCMSPDVADIVAKVPEERPGQA
jgi:hypothetical protein